MAMDQNEFYTQLARRYAENVLSEEEYEVFFHALEAGLLDHSLVTAMTEAGAVPGDPLTEAVARETADLVIGDPAVDVPATPVRRFPRWTRTVAAAAIIALLAGGTWLWLNRAAHTATEAGELAQQPIPPAGNKATLTLSNGQTIILDSAARGSLAIEGNTRVQKTDSGKLAYVSMGHSSGSAVLYNTLATPRGGHYQLTLPDGTRVWLNAASAITYPTAFQEKERQVEVTGEVYFEVAKNASQPFKVRVKDREDVEVLGTSFDVNAYPDETDIRTTLLEGSVRVTAASTKSRFMLKPGQQAQVVGTQINVLPDADTAAAVAWITGFFQFRELDVPAVMRQISRWYDVDLVYDAPAASLTGHHFGGRISRRQNLSDLLPILEANQIHFRIDGTTIHVLP
jgi:transmembrane sensor